MNATRIALTIALVIALTLGQVLSALTLGWPLGSGIIGYGAMGGEVWMLIPTILWVWIPNLMMLGFATALAWVELQKQKPL